MLPGQQKRSRRIRGDARHVILSCLRNRAHTTAGAERISTRGLRAHRSLRILADRHARNLEEHARILAACNATLDHARHVLSSGQRRLAFAGRTPRRSCAEKPTTKMVGAARRFAAIFCPAESTFAQTLAIPDSVETAISRWTQSVIAVVLRRRSLATSGKRYGLHIAWRTVHGSRALSAA